MSEKHSSDEKSVIEEFLANKKKFDRNQIIIFFLSLIVFIITLSHIIGDVFLH